MCFFLTWHEFKKVFINWWIQFICHLNWIDDPKQLLHPTDSQGNVCGTDDLLNQTYVNYFDWTQCIKAFNIPQNILKGHVFVCPTRQVCVQEQYPKKKSYCTCGNDYANGIYTDAVAATTDTNNEKLVHDGKCAA
jgi:hypothetical protein